MQPSPNSSNQQTWSMKDAAHMVGAGLPRLYTRLREKGLFTRLGLDGRNLPTRKLQNEGLFIVEAMSWWDPQNKIYKPCPKVKATYKGIILLQEIADELAREKEQPNHERPGVSDPHHSDHGAGEVLRAGAEPGNTGCDGHVPGSEGTLRKAPETSEL